MKFTELFGSLLGSTRKAAAPSGDFEKECLGADPQDLRRLVEEEQAELEREVGETVAAIQFQTKALMQRIAQLPAKGVDAKLDAIREAQDALRRVLRRYAASAKRSLELERELELWQHRADEAGDLWADHPKVRAEIVRSELASRGIEAAPRALSAKANTAMHELSERLSMGETDEEEMQMEDVPFDPHPDTAHLIQAIREATQEAERWHGHYAEDPLDYREAADQVRHVRDLHGALKLLDRRNGVARDRVALAVRMRDE